MGFFNRTKKEPTKQYVPEPAPPLKKCQHKFQDFPWYIEGEESNGISTGAHWYHLTIKEPYVCIYCGERQDKVLWEITRYGTHKEATECLDAVAERFKVRIKHRAEIEDMINDMKLVDPQYLQYYHMIQGTKDPLLLDKTTLKLRKILI